GGIGADRRGPVVARELLQAQASRERHTAPANGVLRVGLELLLHDAAVQVPGGEREAGQAERAKEDVPPLEAEGPVAGPRGVGGDAAAPVAGTQQQLVAEAPRAAARGELGSGLEPRPRRLVALVRALINAPEVLERAGRGAALRRQAEAGVQVR